MKFTDLTLNVGAEKPFDLIHFSDIHLTYADGRDDDRKIELAKNRTAHFRTSQENLDAVIAEARRTGALLVSTGDLLDFVSHANVDAARKFTDENDCFFATGNHEFSLYVGEAFEDVEYRNRSLSFVQSAFKNDIRFSARVINGVKLIAIDDGYYLFDRPQLEALKKECAEGLPVILMMHVPLFTPALCHEMMAVRGETCSYLVAAPEELIQTYTEYRARQQRPDVVTLETVEFIKTCPAIKAILCGHIHGAQVDDPVTDTLTQYSVGTDNARRIRVV